MGKQEELEKLKREVLEADIPLKRGAANLVFGRGNPDAEIMLIGEGPGKNEDIQGLPFVGKAGQLLEQMLKKINLTLNDIYIANILKYRPPDNRDPNEEEIRTHTPFLVQQIEIIKPKIILPLGNYAAKFILSECNADKMDEVPGITQLHGKEKQVKINGCCYAAMPMYHPAAQIYNRNLLPQAENDFRKLRERLDKESRRNAQKGLMAFGERQ